MLAEQNLYEPMGYQFVQRQQFAIRAGQRLRVIGNRPAGHPSSVHR